MKLLKSFDIVLELAEQNIVEDQDLAEEREEQVEACQQLRNMMEVLKNHEGLQDFIKASI